MPIYEYICEDCRKPFEKLVMRASEKISCPDCGGKRNAMQYSVVAAPGRRGDGGYCETGGSTGGATGGDTSVGGCGGCSPSGCGCH